MQLISDSLKESLWQQIVHEKYNASIYLFIAGFLKNKGYDNLAKIFIGQYSEENEHAMQIFDLLTDLNTPVSIGEVGSGDFYPIETPKDIADIYLAREMLTTDSLCEIKNQAMDEGNGVVEELIRKMVSQQQKEYEESTTFADKVEALGNDWKYVMLWDISLG